MNENSKRIFFQIYCQSEFSQHCWTQISKTHVFVRDRRSYIFLWMCKSIFFEEKNYQWFSLFFQGQPDHTPAHLSHLSSNCSSLIFWKSNLDLCRNIRSHGFAILRRLKENLISSWNPIHKIAEKANTSVVLYLCRWLTEILKSVCWIYKSASKLHELLSGSIIETKFVLLKLTS